MSVKELIAELQKADGNLEVRVAEESTAISNSILWVVKEKDGVTLEFREED